MLLDGAAKTTHKGGKMTKKIHCKICGKQIIAHWYRDEYIQDIESFVSTMLSGSEPEDGMVADTFLEPKLVCGCDKPTLEFEDVVYLIGEGIDAKNLTPLIVNDMSAFVDSEVRNEICQPSTQGGDA